MIDTLFASFYGNSIFTIFYQNLQILNSIAEQLEQMEFPKQVSKNGEEHEH